MRVKLQNIFNILSLFRGSTCLVAANTTHVPLSILSTGNLRRFLNCKQRWYITSAVKRMMMTFTADDSEITVGIRCEYW
jgi:hypothetical protein